LGLALAACLLESLALPGAAAAQTTLSTVLVFPQFRVASKDRTELRLTNVGTVDSSVALSFICAGDAESFCPGSVVDVSLVAGETRRIDVDTEGPGCDEGFATAVSDQPLIGSYRAGRGRQTDAGDALGNEWLGTPLVDFRAVKGSRGGVLTLADLDAAPNGSNAPRTVDIELRGEAGGAPVATSFAFTCFARVPLDEIDPAFLEKNLGSERGWLRIDANGSRVAATLTETDKGVRVVRVPFVKP
jgi:hypothetical protein